MSDAHFERDHGTSPTPQDVIDEQQRAYNARDVEAFVAVFASDATVTNIETMVRIARGHDEIRAFYAARFEASPDLRCEVVARMHHGSFVVDHERVAGIDEVPLDVVAIYEVRDFLIRSLDLVMHPLDKRAAHLSRVSVRNSANFPQFQWH